MVSVIVTDYNGGSDTISATITQPPAVPVTINNTSSTVCPGGSINLSASGAASYSWSPPVWLNTTTGQNVISTPSTSINYVVTGTDLQGCFNTDTISINVLQSISVSVTPSNPTGCFGEDIYVNLTAGAAVTYTWHPSSGVTSIPATPGSGFLLSPPSSTNYQVLVNYGVGCIDSLYFVALEPNESYLVVLCYLIRYR